MTKQAVRQGSVEPLDLLQPANVFHDTVESEFYARGVKEFLLRSVPSGKLRRPIAELGTGTGEAISTVLADTGFPGEVHGYEIQAEACNHARRMILQKGVPGYRVVRRNFFAVAHRYTAGYVISNPPYLPAPNNEIKMPELWGGPDGSRVTRQLLSRGFEGLVVTLSSFSNPLATIAWAIKRKYRVADFAITTIHFGQYSSEPKVQAQIDRLVNEPTPKAFIRGDRYSLACVFWAKESNVDLTDSLTAAITCLSPLARCNTSALAGNVGPVHAK